MSSPSPRRVLFDSVPIAGIMLFWLVVSWLGSHPLLGTGARIAGVVMALTYAIIRSIAFVDQTDSSPVLADFASVLRVNGLALLSAGGWFVVARLVLVVEQLWGQLALPGVFSPPAEGLAFAFTATGVVTVFLYAVTLTTATIRGGSLQDQTLPSGSPADD